MHLSGSTQELILWSFKVSSSFFETFRKGQQRLTPTGHAVFQSPHGQEFRLVFAHFSSWPPSS